MLVVVDTNVMWQAFKGNGSVSREILNLVLRRKIDLILSEAVFLEYEDVLKRPFSLSQFRLEAQQVDTILDLVLAVATWQKINYRCWPNLKAAADHMLVELAVLSGAQFIITSNIRNFTIQSRVNFDDIRIVTPFQFFHIWRQNYE